MNKLDGGIENSWKNSKYFYTIFNINKYSSIQEVFVANSYFASMNRSINLLNSLNRVVSDWLKDEKWLSYGSVLLIISGSSKKFTRIRWTIFARGTFEPRPDMVPWSRPSPRIVQCKFCRVEAKAKHHHDRSRTCACGSARIDWVNEFPIILYYIYIFYSLKIENK